ncbi:GNAT family N-acetyltransferase [Halobacillus naozhouensis]|uniref:GNAT family N-acetyltransferase n=1 Tax=Halobacillus naozhouensis TaxID=554880 RepID=A0ABY8J6U8_9BACI|nr:GNAT family N-acetyltransferase [Halobacillus naozhouensis]WFT76490.1 GNAT family N-acetyltransferase [Halobacillus naozhouensis]
MKNAENEVEQSKSKILKPIHLLIACFYEKTGALGEVSLKCSLDAASLRAQVEDMKYTSNQNIVKSPLFKINVTAEIINVFEVAISIMNRYNQVYLNEGHVLKALIKANFIDEFLTDYNKEIILTLGTTSRDMITHLGDYTFPTISSHVVRKVKHNDFDELVKYVEQNYSYEWSKTIKDGFKSRNPSIYIALNNKEGIIGFAAFDVFKNKKCYFGPMGVSESNRTDGIGYSLLHHCLRDMKEIGYEYAIIGGAGPIEFYEKACNAVVIPSS